MKKFTFMLVAAFSAVMSYAQVTEPVAANEVDRQVEDNALIEQNTYKFDFLQWEGGLSSQTSEAGDVKDGVVFEQGFLTITNTNAADVTNSFQTHANMNMFYAYAGSSLKFEVPYGSHIDRIDLDFSQWGAGSHFDKGSYTNSGNGRQTWTPSEADGDVRDVTLFVDGVVSRFYSITVYVTSDKYVEPTEEVLAAAEDYNIDAIYFYWGSSKFNPVHIQKTIQASYDDEGNIYLQGLAYYDDEAWVKGAVDLENNTITIEPQVWYEDDFGVTYFVGFDNEGNNAGAVVLNIVENEDGTKTLQLADGVIAENDGQKDSFDAWGYYGNMTVNEGEYVHPVPLVVPEDLVTLEYVLDGQDYYGQNIRHILNVGIGGEDVLYIQGLSMYLPEAWVMAQITERNEQGIATKAVVPAYQYLGAYYDESTGEIDFYLNDNSWYLYGDIELNIDPETSVITTDNKININNFNELFERITVGDVTVYPVDPAVVSEPMDLKIEEFYYSQDGEAQIDANKHVAFDAVNNKLYIQGLCPDLPEAWVVGDVDLDNQTVTLQPDQFMGQVEDEDGEMVDLWLNFHGNPYTLNFTRNALMTLDTKEGDVLGTQYTWTIEGFNEFIFNQRWKDTNWEGYTDLFTKEVFSNLGEEFELTRVQTYVPDMPEIVSVNAIMVGDGVVEVNFNVPEYMTYEDEYGVEQQMAIPAADMSYQLFYEQDGEWKPIFFTQELYTDLPEDKSELKLNEAYEGIRNGKIIIKDNVVLDWTKIGLCSYYRAPFSQTWRESEMAEVVLKNIATGIQEQVAANEAASYTDMQGRQAQASAKGLLIKQVRTADGSVKTVKVVRK